MGMLTDAERIEAAAARASDPTRFKEAIAQMDLLNDDDPKRMAHEGREVGYELYFSRLLFAKVLDLEPNASEALALAARSQHICRWKMPRSDYPMDRAGYLKWRSDLKRYHASMSARILEEAGYEEAVTKEVEAINLKKGLTSNPDTQTMEDALCLVFLESQFEDFRQKTSEEKMIRILQKTWGKMSERGREAALGLSLGADGQRLVEAALSGEN